MRNRAAAAGSAEDKRGYSWLMVCSKPVTEFISFVLESVTPILSKMGDDHSLMCLVGAFGVPLITLFREESAHRENPLMVHASDPAAEMFLSGKWKEESYADEDWIANSMQAVSKQVGCVTGRLEIARLEAEMDAIFGSAAGSEGEFPNAGDSARECEEGALEAEDAGLDYSRMCHYHLLTVEVLCLECGGEGICEHAEDSSVCRQCRPTTEALGGE
eukprot:3356637-Rhodomonas_salina.1